MFSLRSLKGCLLIGACELLISIAIFSFFSLPSFISILYGLSILFVLERSYFFSFLEDKTIFEFIETSLQAAIRLVVLILALSYLFHISLDMRTIKVMIIVFTVVNLAHFLFLYLLPQNKRKVILVGINEHTKQIIAHILNQKISSYKIEGVLTNQKIKEINSVPVIGSLNDINKLADKVDIIVFCLSDWRKKIDFYDLMQLKFYKIKFVDGNLFYEKLKKSVLINHFLRPSYFLFYKDHKKALTYLCIKNIAERIIALTGLILLSPLLLIIAGLIKIDSPGPIFYVQERVGLNGKVFRLIKFRSMIKDAEKYTGPVFAQENDPRITRVGKILRRFRLDELPQLINVLKGEMSLIGPRPERPYFVEKMKEVIPYYDLRHTVKPGITGWAQVNYKYGDSIEDGKRKLEYDLYYIRHQSLLLDLLILLLTIRVAIFTRKY